MPDIVIEQTPAVPVIEAEEKTAIQEAVAVIEVAKEIAEEIAAPGEVVRDIGFLAGEIASLRDLIMEFRNENSMVHAELNSRLQMIHDELEAIQVDEIAEVISEETPEVKEVVAEVKEELQEVKDETPTPRETKKRKWL